MKAKHYVAVSVIIFLLIPGLRAVLYAREQPSEGNPQPKQTAEQRDTLRGVRGLGIYVERLEPEIERCGLTQEALLADTEAQLRQHGIRVLSYGDQEWQDSPFLYIAVSLAGDDDTAPFVGMSLLVQCYQEVSLLRDPTIRCFAATWSHNRVGRLKPGNLSKARDAVKDIVGVFINDYVAANSKQSRAQTDARLMQPPKATPPVYKMGSTVIVGYMSYVVQKALAIGGVRNADGTPALAMIITVTVGNKDRKARTIPPFTLVDENGAEYSSFQGYNRDDFQPFDSLNPGMSRTGQAMFTVPARHRYRLKLSGGFSSPDSAFVEIVAKAE